MESSDVDALDYQNRGVQNGIGNVDASKNQTPEEMYYMPRPPAATDKQVANSLILEARKRLYRPSGKVSILGSALSLNGNLEDPHDSMGAILKLHRQMANAETPSSPKPMGSSNEKD
ncbi:hypothetical protein Ciccas_004673 [Cichlidogyrus casuarinus]|uniref:Uncharacterized protein n=1 Tax=Cichlidogyrus casuarinus TaxID=1844966 RepID=A0ABD2QAV5_9PLAT